MGKRTDQALCEDQLVTGEIVAVIDGSTDKSGLSYEWSGAAISSGRFAALMVAQALEGIPAGTSPRKVVDRLTVILDKAIRDQHPDIADYDRPSCVITAFDPVLHTIWWVGDAWHGIRHHDGTVEQHRDELAIDAMLVPMRVRELQRLAHAGMPWDPASGIPDPGRASLGMAHRMQGLHANTTGPYGYGVLNGMPVPDVHLHTRSVPVDATNVVLATDGYPAVAIDGVMDLQAAEQHLARLLEQDPLCVGPLAGLKAKMPGSLSFDDRTWLRLLNVPYSIAVERKARSTGGR